MFTPAHIAASYLLSQTPRLVGIPLSSSEIVAIIVTGNILDLDFIFGTFMGKKGDDHHNFITHTPAFILTIWIIGFIFFNSHFNQFIWILLLISAILHLVLDDVGYWFCKLGWQDISKYPQINWLYPLRSFHQRKYEKGNQFLLKNYFTKAKINIFLELLLVIVALTVATFEYI